ncbi:MAG TPA: thymidine phosphorylase, partial [Roseiarcus sp.]|nr:thymidine phosphorylase [Roseiarcus sp.]
IPLITASILSKKLAAGLQGLVMDVKTGSGAFMASLDEARDLARSLAHVATGAGLPTDALVTDMNEPLASAAGNAVEVLNAVEYLTGVKRDKRLDEVTKALGGQLLALGGLVEDAEEGETEMERSLASGAAAERFERMVVLLGGPKNFLAHAASLLPKAPHIAVARASRRGFVEAIDVRAVGMVVVTMGGGRTRAADSIDPAVGLTGLAGLGAEVGPDAPLAVIHARNEAQAAAAGAALAAAYRIGEAAPATHPPVVERIAGAS